MEATPDDTLAFKIRLSEWRQLIFEIFGRIRLLRKQINF